MPMGVFIRQPFKGAAPLYLYKPPDKYSGEVRAYNECSELNFDSFQFVYVPYTLSDLYRVLGHTRPVYASHYAVPIFTPYTGCRVR